MFLRDYQAALADEVRSHDSTSSVVLQLPTGAGKTHIAADLIRTDRRLGKRIWFVCHRREIADQASLTLDRFSIPHGVVGANRPIWEGWQVQVCSITKLKRAISKLPLPDLVIWDECHHIAAESWSQIKASLPKAKHIGLTATPARLDGQGLSEFFDEMIIGPSTRDLIRQGFLADYRVFAPTIPDLHGVGVRGGDFDRNALAERMGGDVLVGDVVDHYRRIASGRRAVAFAVSVEASRTVSQRFNQAGIAAAHIDASTPAAVRQKSIDDLAAGRIMVLSNVELFTEGFDLPAIDAVILLRPTRSLALFRQMVGRGLRTAEGKSDTIFLDHAGLVHLHGMPDDDVEWSLTGTQRGRSAASRGFLRRCPECLTVHPSAPTCDSCGHEYEERDRTIDEVYGHLSEIKRLAGQESRKEFAERIGVSPERVKQLVKTGLPICHNGLVQVDEALKWLSQRKQAKSVAPYGDSVSFETQSQFASRIGFSHSGVVKLVKKGLPTAQNGWVHIGPALDWFDEYKKKNIKIEQIEKVVQELPAGEQWAAFKARTGVLPSKQTLVSAGLPLHPDGSINSHAADEWIKTARTPKGAVLPGFETKAAFAKRIGWWPRGNSMKRLKQVGLPVEANGLVSINKALAWAHSNSIVRSSKHAA